MRAGITFFVAGCLLILLSAVMVIPTVLDFADGQTAAGTAFRFDDGIFGRAVVFDVLQPL